jgi:hypothetical protein
MIKLTERLRQYGTTFSNVSNPFGIDHVRVSREPDNSRPKRCDVWLVIRASDAKIRWMNVTEYLKKHSKPDNPVKHIVFHGEEFNVDSLLAIRNKLLTEPNN